MNPKELIDRLRTDAEWAEGQEWETPICLQDDLREAIAVIAELLQAKEDGRLVVLQSGVTKQDLQEEYCKAKHLVDEQLPSPGYTTGFIAGFGAGVIHILDKILTREEAEAALAGGDG